MNLSDLTKQDLFAEAFARCPLVKVYFDARQSGVRIPDQFHEDPNVVFQYGKGVAKSDDDTSINEWGIRSTLSFGGTPFVTAVPWAAVYAITTDSGETALWEEDIPRAVATANSVVANGDAQREPVGKRKGHLRVV